MIRIKRKILLESSIDRTTNSPTWGKLTADTFYINVFLSQNMDNMGMFTDTDFIPYTDTSIDYSLVTNKLELSGITFPFMSNNRTPIISGTSIVTNRLPQYVESKYYDYGNSYISGNTDSKIDELKSYDSTNTYKVGFDINTQTYTDYDGTTISGVSRVVSVGEPTIYVFDTLNDSNIGTTSQKTGLKYLDYSGISRNVIIDGVKNNIPVTNFSFIGEGLNETNVSLSALTKEEYLFGIISPPEVKSNLFIDRGTTTVMEKHLKLSEIMDLDALSRYGKGYFNLTKQ